MGFLKHLKCSRVYISHCWSTAKTEEGGTEVVRQLFLVDGGMPEIGNLVLCIRDKVEHVWCINGDHT